MESFSSEDEDKEEEMNSKVDDRGLFFFCFLSFRWYLVRLW